MTAPPAYTLYTGGVPNGVKVSITMEELGVEYKVAPIDITKNEQKEESFMKINPNGRVPALVDHSAGDLNVFESGAIMFYLASKHTGNGLWPEDFKEQAHCMSWLMWQMGGLGPMQGQANWFTFIAPRDSEPQPYPIKRYIDETHRLHETLEKGLEGKQFLVGNRLTIADIACFSWAIYSPMLGITFDKLPNIKSWLQRIAERPAVQRGLAVPPQSTSASFNSWPVKLVAFLTGPDGDAAVKERFDAALKTRQSVGAV